MTGVAGKLRLAIARGVLRLVNDARKIQECQVQLLADEVKDDAEHFQHYGFTSVPLAGAEVLAFSIAGNRGHVVLHAADDRRYRKKGMEGGEVALYTDEGDYILLKRGRIVEVKAGTEVRVDVPLATFTGNVHVQGSITCDHDVSDMKGSMQEMRDTFNAHTHEETGGTSQGPNEEMA